MGLPAGRWPLARGFERFYGFLGGDTSQWYPDLVGSPDHPSPFRFTGTLHKVVVDVSGELIRDSESEMRMALARQ